MFNKTTSTIIRKLAILWFLSLSLGGCATPAPTIASGPDAEITFDGLHEVKNSASDIAWAMPGLDLSGFTKMMVQVEELEGRFAEFDEFVVQLSEKREDLQRQIRDLSADRSGYIAKKVDEAGGMKGSLDQKLYDAVKEQAGEAGLEYKDGPAY